MLLRCCWEQNPQKAVAQDVPSPPSALPFIPELCLAFRRTLKAPCSIQCPHAQVMRSTKYTARQSVGMCRVKSGNTEGRHQHQSPVSPRKPPIGRLSAEDPPAGPGRGLKLLFQHRSSADGWKHEPKLIPPVLHSCAHC